MDFVSRANGGIFEAERRMQQSLQVQGGVDVLVEGLQDPHTESDRTAWQPLNPVAHAVRGPQAFGFAPGLLDALLSTDADLAYCAGLWKYPSLAALRWSRQTGKPMVVAPHGMLEAWALRNSRFKKQIAGWIYQKAQLHHAVCLRALCESEANSMRAYGLKNSVCIIPNGIDFPEIGNHEAERRNPPWHAIVAPGRKVLLFLSRIHPKKGLANLLQAWAQNQENGNRGQMAEWVLAIAGWDQGGHEAELKAQARELGLSFADVRDQKSADQSQCSLVFLGPQFGEAKAACYQNCDAFILPSLSEGLPMVVLEAWARGKPVLMTPECNLPEGFAMEAAVRIYPHAQGIQEGLQRLIGMSESDRRTMGLRGEKLVSERFTWPKVAVQMRDVYAWVLGGGPPPSTVECR
jgi:glycosyltransferase involved in cell wall biosynthesis